MEKFDLKTALMEHHPYDECEALAVREILRFLNDEENAFSRENKAGHVTGSALVVDSAGNILLNHHRKAGIWIQFGGHCEGETDVRRVALREVTEESGILESKLQFLTPSFIDCAVYNIPANRTKDEPAHKHYDINFLLLSSTHDFVVSNESTELKWCTPAEALKLVAGDPACTRMIKKSIAIFATKQKLVASNQATFNYR